MIRHLHRVNLLRGGCRNYLTQAYKCEPAWEARLTSQTLSKINLDQFYADVETKHQQQKKLSAVDVDIFVNKVTGDNYIDEMADIIHKLRMTGEASNVLDSTSHAVVRNFAGHDQIDFLLQILRDPLNYGVFLDTFCANLLLDKLVEEKQFTAAAEVASFLMLQEDFGDDITRGLCLLSAFKYAANPEPFVKVEPVPEKDKNTPTPPPPPTKGKKGKKEELRVRVKFLRNEYFDGHFDLKEPNQLVGKTLILLSSELPVKYQSSSKLLGLCMSGKYAECLKFIDGFNKENLIHKEVLEMSQKTLEATPSESEEYKTLLEKMNLISGKATIVEENLEDSIVAVIKSSIEKLEKGAITEQEQVKEILNFHFSP